MTKIGETGKAVDPSVGQEGAEGKFQVKKNPEPGNKRNSLLITKTVDTSIYGRFVEAIGTHLNAAGLKNLLEKLHCSENADKIPDGFPDSMFKALANGEMTIDVAKKLLNEFHDDLGGKLSAGQGVMVFKMNIAAQDKVGLLKHFEDDLSKGGFEDYLAYKLVMVEASGEGLVEGADFQTFFDETMTLYEADDHFFDKFLESLDKLISDNKLQNELSGAVRRKLNKLETAPVKATLDEKLQDAAFFKSLLNEGDVKEILAAMKAKTAKEVDAAAEVAEAVGIDDELDLLLKSDAFTSFIEAFGGHITTQFLENPKLLKSVDDAENFLVGEFTKMVNGVFEDEHDFDADPVGKAFIGLVKKFTQILEPEEGVKKPEKTRAQKIGAMIVLILKKTVQGVKNSFQMYFAAASGITSLVPIIIGLGASGPVGWGIGAGLLGALVLFAFIQGVRGASIEKALEVVGTASAALAPMAAAVPAKEGAPVMDPTFKAILDFGAAQAKKKEEEAKKQKAEADEVVIDVPLKV